MMLITDARRRFEVRISGTTSRHARSQNTNSLEYRRQPAGNQPASQQVRQPADQPSAVRRHRRWTAKSVCSTKLHHLIFTVALTDARPSRNPCLAAASGERFLSRQPERLMSRDPVTPTRSPFGGVAKHREYGTMRESYPDPLKLASVIDDHQVAAPRNADEERSISDRLGIAELMSPAAVNEVVSRVRADGYWRSPYSGGLSATSGDWRPW